MNLLITILLSGIIGYIPYRYLIYTSFISEKGNKNDIFKMIIFSIEVFLIGYIVIICSVKIHGENIPSNFANLLPYFDLTNIFIIIFLILLFTFLINPLIIIGSRYIINFTRKILKLEKICFKDKRDALFNNNKKSVFVIVKDFDNNIIKEGSIKNYTSQRSSIDILEIEKQDFKVSDLKLVPKKFEHHSLLDLNKQLIFEIYLEL
ncbi:ATPase [Staphylococcus aureus]|uniref:ATPase n=4 Tax=Staphylococcus aureus TaxID=1280 RepID=UPI000D02670A|nr:ATPase [Staphylococcus aureus]KAA1264233.1 ATPase [Staphylococcus aureus]MBW5882576.1 ATPase [Staphylococcus aureus]MDV0042386.1 ATPase [Staphylococcus aureus]MDV0050303.1 ATPase [Staphylococcus aureus]MDV0052936.1 ATPase [Staphylococcus aureus]